MKTKDDYPILLAIPTIHGCDIAETGEITHLTGEGNQTAIYLISKITPVIASACLGHYEEILDPELFIRVHRSHIIHLKFLKKYINGKFPKVLLKNDVELPVSHEYKNSLEELLYRMR